MLHLSLVVGIFGAVNLTKSVNCDGYGFSVVMAFFPFLDFLYLMCFSISI